MDLPTLEWPKLKRLKNERKNFNFQLKDMCINIVKEFIIITVVVVIVGINSGSECIIIQSTDGPEVDDIGMKQQRNIDETTTATATKTKNDDIKLNKSDLQIN